MKRWKAREIAFKILFELQINEQAIDVNEKSDDLYIRQVLNGWIEKREEIDGVIKKYLKNWTFSRVAPIDKTILRLSVFEMLYMEDIPNAVSINEAIELAHKYGDEQSSKFINGVLSNVNRGV